MIKEIPRKTFAVNVKQNISSYHLIFVKAYNLSDARDLALAEAEDVEFGPTRTYYSIDDIKEVKSK